MTKTVEELHADWRAAQKATGIARDAEIAARKAYEDAALEATGLKGHKVAYQYKQWHKPVETRHILVDRSYGTRLSGKRILKDGSLGTMRADVEIADATDCGVYQPSEG